jgi:hypothetical protein
MFKPNQYPKIQAIYIFLLTITWSLSSYSRGVKMAGDSNTYSNLADTLIAYNFNIFNLIETVDTKVPLLFYYNWLSIVAINKLTFGDNWGLGIVFFNLLAGIFAAILLFKSTWTTTRNPACVILAGLLVFLCHDFVLWIPFVLSDTLFSSLCFLIFTLTISLYQRPAELSRKVVWIVVLLCFALFFRPVWPPLLIFALFSTSLAIFFNSIASDPNKRHRFIIGSIFTACIVIPAIIFYHSYIMLHPDKWPFSLFTKMISFISIEYQKGIVIRSHFETYHSPSANILEYVFITLHKFIGYFYISVDSYSFKHSLLNYIFFVPVYGLSFFAVAQLFKKGNGPSPSNWWYIFSCTLFIFLFAFFHSLHQIDYDFRYRVPCLLPLIFLATLGLNELINGFYKRT